jgi:predicted RNA-binding Zn-ribbon protein involved in translation (DUF1610 family)
MVLETQVSTGFLPWCPGSTWVPSIIVRLSVCLSFNCVVAVHTSAVNFAFLCPRCRRATITGDLPLKQSTTLGTLSHIQEYNTEALVAFLTHTHTHTDLEYSKILQVISA